MNRMYAAAFAVVALFSACSSDDEGGGGGGNSSGGLGNAGGTGGKGGTGGADAATGGNGGSGGNAGADAATGGNGGSGGNAGAGGKAGASGNGGIGGIGGTGGASGSAGQAGVGGASGASGSAGQAGSAGSDAGSTDASASDGAPDAIAPAPTVSSIAPNNGLANQPTPKVVITGTGLESNATVVVAGVTATVCNYSGIPTSITCTVPAKGSVFRGDVVVTNPSSQPGTLIDAFTFTGVLNETSVGGEADFCNLQFPTGANVIVNQPSPVIYGRLFEAGVTEAIGASSQVIAELGYGPNISSPTSDSSWRWVVASYNVQVGNDDEYQSTLTVNATGSYQFTYRFSLDDGFNYTYCDSDGAGSNAGLTFSASSLGTLVATP